MAYRLVPKLDKDGNPTGKVGKPPINPRTGGAGKHNNPATWGSLEEALALGADGVGFTLSEDDPLCIIDIDGAIDEDGALTDLAGQVLDKFRGAYVELSPSGRGLHIIIEGRLPGRGRNSQKLGLEVYDRLRFVTVTGEYFGEQGEVKPMQEALGWLLAEFWPEAPEGKHRKREASPVAAVSLIGDDAVLVEKALSSKQGAKFQKLWFGEWEGSYESHSDADEALCGILQFWTQGDAARMDKLFRQSGLYRAKWDEQHGAQTYGAMTVEKALAGSTGHYSGRGKHKAATVAAEGEHKKKEEAGKLEPLTIPPEARSPDPDNDQANAVRLAETYGDQLRYVRKTKEWLVWNGRFWEPDIEGAADKAAALVHVIGAEAQALFERAVSLQDTDKKASEAAKKRALRLLEWRQKSGRDVVAQSTLRRARGLFRVEHEVLDANRRLLNVANGTLELDTGELREHKQTDLITQISPVRYDERAICPRWKDFVAEILNGDPDLIRFVQKAFGYSLSGEVKEECMFFLYGGGRRGKSKKVAILRELLGKSYSKKAMADLLMTSSRDRHPTEVAALRGARVVVAAETEKGRVVSGQRIKDWTGEPNETTRGIRENPYEFPIYFKLWLMSNHRPRVPEDTEAFWERFRVIPFDVAIPEERRDKDLLEKLKGELPGILNWALEGFRLWDAEGLGKPTAVLKAGDEYRKDADTLGRFFDAVLSTDPEDARDGVQRIPSGRLYTTYKDWLESYDNSDPISSAEFKEDLERRGLTWKKEGKGNFYYGAVLSGWSD
jgi:putative DNA primase/helicase